MDTGAGGSTAGTGGARSSGGRGSAGSASGGSAHADATSQEYEPLHFDDLPESDCRLSEARDASRFSIQWSAEGKAEVADVTDGASSLAVATALSTQDGVAFGLWSNRLGQGEYVKRVYRLEDGRGMAALHVQAGSAACTGSLGKGSALFVWHRLGDGAKVRTVFGVVREHGGWEWSRAAFDESTLPPALMEVSAGDHVVRLGLGGLHALRPPAAVWQVVEAGSLSRYGAAGGDLVAWTESTGARLRAWRTGDSSPRTLVESLPGKPCILAVSDTHVVGVLGDQCLGGSRELRLWSLDRATPDELSAPTTLTGPRFVATPYALRTWGRYAALMAADWNQTTDSPAGKAYILVTDVATSRTWRVDPAAGNVIADDEFTVDRTHLYWAETPTSAAPFEIQRLVRVRLDQLDGTFATVE